MRGLFPSTHRRRGPWWERESIRLSRRTENVFGYRALHDGRMPRSTWFTLSQNFTIPFPHHVGSRDALSSRSLRRSVAAPGAPGQPHGYPQPRLAVVRTDGPTMHCNRSLGDRKSQAYPCLHFYLIRAGPILGTQYQDTFDSRVELARTLAPVSCNSPPIRDGKRPLTRSHDVFSCSASSHEVPVSQLIFVILEDGFYRMTHDKIQLASATPRIS